MSDASDTLFEYLKEQTDAVAAVQKQNLSYMEAIRSAFVAHGEGIKLVQDTIFAIMAEQKKQQEALDTLLADVALIKETLKSGPR